MPLLIFSNEGLSIVKRQIILSSILALTALSSSLASDCLRVGISIGSAYHKTKLKVISIGQEIKFDRHDPLVGAFIGYDHLINETPLFIGLEAGVNNHNSEKTLYACEGYKNTCSLKLKTNNSMIGALRLGVSTKDVLVYAKTGLSSTNWQTLIQSSLGDKQTNYQKAGYVFGFGLECKMNRNFSFGLEHQFTMHNSLHNMHPKMDLKISPTTHTTGLRLIYSF